MPVITDPPKVVVFTDGNFSAPLEVQPAFFVDDVVVVDVDDDGLNDLVVSGAGGTQVLLSNGATLLPAPSSAIGGRITVGDIDGDDQVEVLVGVAGGAPFQVLRTAADAALSDEAAVGVALGAGLSAAPAVLQLDDDPGLEVVAVTGGAVQLFRGDDAESCDPDGQTCLACRIR